MRWHCYRNPYLWVRGEGLRLLSDTIHRREALADQAVARRMAVFIPTDGEIMIVDTTSRLQLVSGPASEPLTLDEAKAFLRIDHDADDATITRAITAARQAAEEHLRTILLPQTYTYTTSALGCLVQLPVGPAQMVNLVQSIDSAGAATTVASSQYRLTIDGFGLLFSNLPSGRLAITYSASSAVHAGEVPALVKQGMLHHMAAMLEQRQGLVPLPVQALSCYQPYRRVRV